MNCSTPDLSVHHQLPKLVQTHVHQVGDAMQPSHALSSPSIFPSIRVFSNDSVLRIRWPKFWSFSFSISPSNEYSGLISFRMDWLDLLATNQCVHSHPKCPNYPFPNRPLPTPATISLFSKSVSLFLFFK